MLSLIDHGVVARFGNLEERSSAQKRASAPSVGFIATIGFHLVVAAVLLGLVNIKPPATRHPFFTTNRLVSVVYVPATPAEMPKVTLSVPEIRAIEPVASAEPKPLLPETIPVRTVEVKPVETPTIREERVAEVARPTVPTPVPPTPTVGVFAEAAPVSRDPKPAARIESAGFDAPLPRSADSKLGAASVGAFDAAVVNSDKTKINRDAVRDSGFGAAAARESSPRDSRVVRDGGFGDTPSTERPKASEPAAAVVRAGFDLAPATPNRRAAPEPTKITTPVEVISKPSPIYTDDARRMKIEGTVTLEVEFQASGQIRVLNIVRGLGHGLDEAAIKAAEKIQFKPAQSEGRAVDSRATVQIFFRLA